MVRFRQPGRRSLEAFVGIPRSQGWRPGVDQYPAWGYCRGDSRMRHDSACVEAGTITQGRLQKAREKCARATRGRDCYPS